MSQLKPLVVRRLLEEQDYILVVVNPVVTGVKLPEPLMQAREPVGIHVGWRMAIPVPDLEVTDDGISGTLSFNRSPFPCAFPWASIIQLSVGDEHLLWISPPVEPAPPKGEPPKGEPTKRDRPHLRVVE
ncbi:MAG: hypothetical protein IT371_27425 [Deltaproteobacteria bacterium]|nr:hypothetical protein [Deltaproteobacteria bacterium]